MSQARTAKRYAAFAHKKHVLINAYTNVIKCKSCGNPKLNQHACPSCGAFRSRSVIDKTKEMDKITKVKV